MQSHTKDVTLQISERPERTHFAPYLVTLHLLLISTFGIGCQRKLRPNTTRMAIDSQKEKVDYSKAQKNITGCACALFMR